MWVSGPCGISGEDTRVAIRYMDLLSTSEKRLKIKIFYQQIEGLEMVADDKYWVFQFKFFHYPGSVL